MSDQPNVRAVDEVERLAAPAELQSLGISEYAFAPDDASRVQLYARDGSLVATVTLDAFGGQVYGEANYAGTRYVVEGDNDGLSFQRDGIELAAPRVAAMNAGEATELPASLDELGFRLISGSTVVFADHEEYRSAGEGGTGYPCTPYASSEIKWSTVASLGYYPRSVMCDAAIREVNGKCSNDYCIGCKNTMCDAMCLVGDYFCFMAQGSGNVCACSNGSGGGGEGGGDEGGNNSGGGGEGGGGGGGGGGCISDWDCDVIQTCCNYGNTNSCTYLGCC